MSDKTFQVVFRGKTVSEFSEEQVAVRLAALFKREPAAMRSLFDGERKILKRGLSRDKANQYREVLKKAGALVAVVAERAQESDEPEQPSRRASFAVDESTDQATDAMPAVTDAQATTTADVTVEDDRSTANSESTQVQSVDAQAVGDENFSLAPAGAILDHLKKPEIPELNISELSLDDSGARFSEPVVADPPQFDISNLVALEDYDQLDEQEKPVAVDLNVDLDLGDSDDVLDATPPPPNIEIAIDHLQSVDDFDHLDSSPKPTTPEIDTDNLGLIE